MSLAYTHDRLQLPEGCRGSCTNSAAGSGRSRWWRPPARRSSAILVAYLLMFLLDRAWDTPVWVRAHVAGRGGRRACARVPMAVAPLGLAEPPPGSTRPGCLSRKHPQVGDQLLGIIELVRNDSSKRDRRPCARRRSGEVAKDAQQPRFLRRGADPSASALGGSSPSAARGLRLALLSIPAAAANAWAAVARALGQHARVTPSPRSSPCREPMVVAHGEPFTITARLAEGSRLAARPQASSSSSRRRRSTRQLARRPIRVRAARRRSIPAGSTFRIGDAWQSDDASSRPCAPS